MTATVTLIGLDGQLLPPGAGPALAAARLVVGERSTVDRWVATIPGAVRTGGAGAPRTVEVAPSAELFDSTLDLLAESVGAGEPAVVLASGDPGYFGALRALRERRLPTECLPAVSRVQRVAAMIQRPWDDITVVNVKRSAFGRAVNVCRARPAVAVLTAPGAGPAELGGELVGWRRTLVVLEDVGGPTEELSIVDPAEAAGRTWRGPTVVLSLTDLDQVGPEGWFAGGEPGPPAEGWALPNDAFAHREGVSTSPELRALALARLAPRPGTLLWDVAAGSGAMGIEAGRLGAAVVAVENDPGLYVRLVANARRYGVDVRLVEGAMPDVLSDLPRPDAVFLSTARADVVRRCAGVGANRIVIEIHELGSVGPARDALVDAGYSVDGRLLSSAPIHGLASGGASVERATSTLLLWGTRH